MTDFANGESDGEQGVYSCADCGYETTRAGLGVILFREPADDPHGDLVCGECLEIREEESEDAGSNDISA